MDSIVYLAFWIVFWLAMGYLVAKLFFLITLKKERKLSVNKSKSVLVWQVNEKIAPLLPNFSYNFKDLVFIWKWVDYVIFDWLCEWEVRSVVFLEIKSWKSNLNKNERLIKECIQKWNIKYELFRIE